MTTHNDESLKPCAYCGSTALLQEHPAHSHEGGIAFFMPDYPGSATISCCNDDCNAGMIASTKAEVIAAWNRRAEQPQPAPMQVDSFKQWAISEGLITDVQHGLRCEHSAVPLLRKCWNAALASRAEHAVPEGYVIVPKKATRAMLRPFYECPPEELELAWGALLIVAQNSRPTSNTGE